MCPHQDTFPWLPQWLRGQQRPHLCPPGSPGSGRSDPLFLTLGAQQLSSSTLMVTIGTFPFITLTIGLMNASFPHQPRGPRGQGLGVCDHNFPGGSSAYCGPQPSSCGDKGPLGRWDGNSEPSMVSHICDLRYSAVRDRRTMPRLTGAKVREPVRVTTQQKG
jgi:hypothetical protein